jgi:hypothetical protein
MKQTAWSPDSNDYQVVEAEASYFILPCLGFLIFEKKWYLPLRLSMKITETAHVKRLAIIQ